MSRTEKEFRQIFQALFENLGIFNLSARYLEKYLSYGSLKIWAFKLVSKISREVFELGA